MRSKQLHPATGIRNLFHVCLLLSFAVFCTFPLQAQESTRKKEITKNFTVGENDRLQVDNLYGNIHVTYWKQNEVEIRVLIEAKARSEEQAQACIDCVEIRMEQTGYAVSANTWLQHDGRTKEHVSLSIDYFVRMPELLTCDLSQKYGNIQMPEENKGKCTLRSKYGNIDGGNFSAPLNIESRYGNVTANNVGEATLDVRYSGKVTISNAAHLSIDSRYSNFNLGEIRQVKVDGGYDNLKIAKVEEGEMELRYSNCRLEKLEKRLVVPTFTYGNFDIDMLDSGFEEIRMDARFGNLKAGIAPDASFWLEANGMRFAHCTVEGVKVERHMRTADNQSGFDSNEERRENDNYLLDINGGRHGRILFEGNGYSNIRLNAR